MHIAAACQCSFLSYHAAPVPTEAKRPDETTGAAEVLFSTIDNIGYGRQPSRQPK
jgi:hypothetical protein